MSESLFCVQLFNSNVASSAATIAGKDYKAYA